MIPTGSHSTTPGGQGMGGGREMETRARRKDAAVSAPVARRAPGTLPAPQLLALPLLVLLSLAGAAGGAAAPPLAPPEPRGRSRSVAAPRLPRASGDSSQHFFAFEGLIGAGKSTLLARLEQKGISIVAEPLQAWQDSGIFGMFYSNMTRWSYTFQTAAFVSRVKAVEDALKNEPAKRHFVGERSWFADAYVFERLLHRDGHVNDVEHAAYEQWWPALSPLAPETRGIIYLRARPETCLSRIQKRQREGEEGIPLAYLEGLYGQHEKWLVDKETPYGAETRKVLVLDANPEFEEDEQRVQGMIDAIVDFMQKCEDDAKRERARSESVVRDQALRRTLSGTELPKGTLYWDGPPSDPQSINQMVGER